MPCCLVPQECIVALRHVLINEEADRRDAGMPAMVVLLALLGNSGLRRIGNKIGRHQNIDACRQGSMCRYLREIYTL